MAIEVPASVTEALANAVRALARKPDAQRLREVEGQLKAAHSSPFGSPEAMNNMSREELDQAQSLESSIRSHLKMVQGQLKGLKPEKAGSLPRVPNPRGSPRNPTMVDPAEGDRIDARMWEILSGQKTDDFWAGAQGRSADRRDAAILAKGDPFPFPNPKSESERMANLRHVTGMEPEGIRDANYDPWKEEDDFNHFMRPRTPQSYADEVKASEEKHLLRPAAEPTNEHEAVTPASLPPNAKFDWSTAPKKDPKTGRYRFAVPIAAGGAAALAMTHPDSAQATEEQTAPSPTPLRDLSPIAAPIEPGIADSLGQSAVMNALLPGSARNLRAGSTPFIPSRQPTTAAIRNPKMAAILQLLFENAAPDAASALGPR